eukprot:1180305-Prorocentrum_minimum.AAC.1
MCPKVTGGGGGGLTSATSPSAEERERAMASSVAVCSITRELSIDAKATSTLACTFGARSGRGSRGRLARAGHIQGTFGAHSGHIRGTFRGLEGVWHVQGTFGAHAGHIQGTFRAHSGHIQGTFRGCHLPLDDGQADVDVGQDGEHGVSVDDKGVECKGTQRIGERRLERFTDGSHPRRFLKEYPSPPYAIGSRRRNIPPPLTRLALIPGAFSEYFAKFWRGVEFSGGGAA